jgi:formylglycine-generating enzyme required for sulfatase activity
MTTGVSFRALCALLGTALLACAAPQTADRAAGEPGMVRVDRGRFRMGRDEGLVNERPEHRVKLDAYDIDRCEVSAGEFAAFLQAQGNPEGRYFTPDEHATVVLREDPADPARKDYTPRPGYERHPANNVSWYGADAYCRWKGKRLPTEAEWEKAARGKDDRPFPWGAAAPGERTARFDRSWGEERLDVLVPVDALQPGSSPYGALNLSGNVLEWVSDWYRQNLCDFCNPEREANLMLIRVLSGEDTVELRNRTERQDPPRENPRGPSIGSFKVLRGGSWQDRTPEELSVTHRFWLDPAQRFATTGFRCAQ